MLRHLEAVGSSHAIKTLMLSAHYESPDTSVFNYSGCLWWDKQTDRSKADLSIMINGHSHQSSIFRDNSLITKYDPETHEVEIDSANTELWFTNWFDVWAEREWLNKTTHYLGQQSINDRQMDIIEITNPNKAIKKIRVYYDIKTGLRMLTDFMDFDMGLITFGHYMKFSQGIYPQYIKIDDDYTVIIDSLILDLPLNKNDLVFLKK
jgi:hypothetical protein